jgi:hypothetical protein
MKNLFRFIILAAMASLAASTAGAAAIFDVNVNTTALVGAGTFSIDFQFIDGSGSPIDLNNNTVSVTNFNFGTGGALGAPFLFNGAAGSLAAGVTLNDTQFFNEFTQDFNAGNFLSFRIQLTTNADPGGTPDEFSFAILDSSGFEIPTTGPASEFVGIAIDSDRPVPLAYGTAPGAAFTVPQPSVVGISAAVPEPGSAGTAAGAALLLLAMHGRRRKLRA